MLSRVLAAKNTMSSSPTIPVTVDKSKTILRVSDSTPLGTLGAQTSKILDVIFAENRIQSQMFCLNGGDLGAAMRRKLKSARIAMQVFVILYGPMDLFEGIG